MTIDKLALLAALQATTAAVDVAGFGTVTLRQITVAENDALRAAVKKDAPPSDFGLRLVVASVIDDAGAPVFALSDLPALRASAGSKVDKLVEAVLLANGYTQPKPPSAPPADASADVHTDPADDAAAKNALR